MLSRLVVIPVIVVAVWLMFFLESIARASYVLYDMISMKATATIAQQ
jgi:hypothetical protein